MPSEYPSRGSAFPTKLGRRRGILAGDETQLTDERASVGRKEGLEEEMGAGEQDEAGKSEEKPRRRGLPKIGGLVEVSNCAG